MTDIEQAAKAHDLKCRSEFFREVASGAKAHETRKNDRDFRVGDTIVLHEIADGHYTGATVVRTVSYIAHPSEFTPIPEGWVVLSFGRSDLEAEVQRLRGLAAHASLTHFPPECAECQAILNLRGAP